MNRSSNRFIRCGIGLAIVMGLATTGGVAANATTWSGATDPHSVRQTDNGFDTATPKYSDEEIVGLFVFGAGRAAIDHPDIVTKYVRVSQPNVSETTISDLTSQLREANPHFHQEVTVPIQSSDPESILEEQNAFGAALSAITKNTPPASDRLAVGRCALWVAAAGAVVIVVAVAGGAVVQTLVAFNVNWVVAYTQPGESSDFSREMKAADIAAILSKP